MRGFTLIELLAVIAVIAVIAGILIPVTSSVRKNARTMQAASNLRSWGGYLSLYAAEHGGRHPCATATNSKGQKVWQWKDQLVPYVEKELRIQLMSDPNLPSGAVSRMFNADTTFSSCYAMNVKVATLRESPSYLWSIERLGNPTRFIELADGKWNDAWRTCAETFYHDPEKPQNSSIDFRQSGDRANVLFADGHVNTMKREDIKKSMINIDGLD
ncbi:prepilin-type N-terminal cleavage/methylation domain-containing protein [Ruficoccus amylovorans]|nr:prepilin-type N-terminal cleavage/methylation domain-containing protein [Ruficoccus amylovorans]